MANFYGQARSNYFAVKDPEAFTNEMNKYPVEVITKQQDGITLYGFKDNDDNGGGNIDTYWDEETDGFTDVDWEDVFKRHLQDDWVAVIVYCGAEKYRYLSGGAVAYNNKGGYKTLNIYDIYDLALSNNLGSKITMAEY